MLGIISAVFQQLYSTIYRCWI